MVGSKVIERGHGRGIEVVLAKQSGEGAADQLLAHVSPGNCIAGPKSSFRSWASSLKPAVAALHSIG
jgi:hypothetical protein